MNRILFFILGTFTGSFFTMFLMCALQINRINEMENKIKTLQNSLNKCETKI